MKKPIIVSFYTPNYREFAETLKASVKKFQFEYAITEIQPRGPHWINNVYWRANFIKAMLEQFNQDIVWIDADAEIKNYPFLFENFTGDFGAHFRDWPVSDHYPQGYQELLGGTMYFAHNERVLELVDEWIRLNIAMPLQPRSQMVLQEALRDWGGQLVQLPASYTYIRRLMPEVQFPIIEHYQASGQFRRADEEGFSDVSHV